MSLTAVHDGDLSGAAAPTPAARRQRRHRAHRKQGRFVVPIEVTCEMVEALVDQGDVDEANPSDLDRVGEAIAGAARRNLKIKGDIQSPEIDFRLSPNFGHSSRPDLGPGVLLPRWLRRHNPGRCN